MFGLSKKKCEQQIPVERMIRRHYQFFGRVQCVGFRYQAKHSAESMGVTGWVINMIDGSVEMEAQGLPELLDQLLLDLENSRSIRIEAYEVTQMPVEDHEQHFRIRY